MDNTTKALLAIHIAAAVMWVGGGIMLHILGRRALRTGDRQRMLSFSEESDVIGPRFFAPLSFLLLIAGIWLVDKYGYDQAETFIMLGYTGWGIPFLIGVFYYPSAAKRRTKAIETEGLEGPGFLKLYNEVMMVSSVESLILLLVVIDMAVKPGFP